MNFRASGSCDQGGSNAHLRALDAIRACELEHAVAHFPPATQRADTCSVLELGAGAGYQARIMCEAGYRVLAIDMASSYYRAVRVHEVVEYDGRSIPAGDGAFDVVFSSNVLEHVTEIDGLLKEMRRVLKPGGRAVHILPTTSCRVWSIPAHYLWLCKRLPAVVRHRFGDPALPSTESAPRRPTSAREWLGTFVPLPHGERGNTLTEAYYFSSFWWARKFREHGFVVRRIEPNRIFYTMANSMTDSIRFSLRRKLSRLLGSSCRIYVLDAPDGAGSVR
jgi:SAM-dependent methyltransferase